MTRRDWILPGVLFAASAGLFGLSYLLWRAGRLQEILEQERGA